MPLSDYAIEDIGATFVSLWDDLYVLVPAYMLAVFVLTTFGPFRQELTFSKDYKCNNALWKPVMVIYNLILTLFSFGCFIGMGYVVFIKYNGDIATNDCFKISRDPIFVWVIYLFYISKYVEFMDTLFLIVKGKPVIFLHFFHHCGAAINMGILYKSEIEGAFLFVMLNGFVHTIMYTYYGLTLCGYKVPGKSLITSMQICQFLTGFYLFFQYIDLPCFYENAELLFAFYYTYTYVGVVLFLFLNFFVRNYMNKPAVNPKPMKDIVETENEKHTQKVRSKLDSSS